MNSPARFPMKNSNGFSLIEVMVAIVILSIGILSLFAMQTTAIQTNGTASSISIASSWVTDRIEILVNRPYDCVSNLPGCHDLDDDDGDGTNKDANLDGIDDSGGNFGLDDVTAASADGRFTSPDGRYQLFWNVAVDVPVPDSKTIRVIAVTQDRNTARTVPMTYIKAKSQ